MAARKYIDCRNYPDPKVKCSVAIAGTEDEVLDIAVEHASKVHGHAKGPELRKELRSMLKDVPASEKAMR